MNADELQEHIDRLHELLTHSNSKMRSMRKAPQAAVKSSYNTFKAHEICEEIKVTGSLLKGYVEEILDNG